MKNICIKNNGDNIIFYDYKLSILITQGGLSYSLYSVTENKFNSLVSRSFAGKDNYIAEIEDFIISEGLLDKDFKQIDIVYSNNKVTIVPDVLFNNSDAEKLYYLNFEMNDDNSCILFSKLSKSENTIIFSVKQELKQALDKLFKNYNLISHSVPFIETNFTKNKISENREKTRMFVQVFEDFADILVFRDEKMLLYNTFKYKTNNDLLYFIINVFDQLKLSQEDTEVSFSGFVETDNLAVINLRKFVRIVYFESQNPEFKYYYKFQETLPHYFVNLLNVVKCG